MHCGYCGRVSHRCQCHAPGSDLLRFLARGGRERQPLHHPQPYKQAVPPQIKRRERQTLKANHRRWHADLVKQYGEACLNCGAGERLVLDHIVPIAKGGLSGLDNLQLLCGECNRLKGKLVIDCRPD